jgi:CheY-like chemotaxis protein
MPRPRTVLWIDDEVESLSAHLLFLKEHGYEVELAAHGDDALALLRRQPYGVILLDEQLPGRRGLELVPEIRSIDPAVPVVMVTKSEEAATMHDAIGIRLEDYLVKPVNPRQVLTVVTRLLEGDRIRQQRLARDFVTRFRELEQRRGAPLGWREWTEVVVETMQWDARLGQSDETGLQDALKGFQTSLHDDFAQFIRQRYPDWLAHPNEDRPPLSVDVCSEFLVPLIEANESVMFVVVDCLRLDQWELIKPQITELFDMEESYYFSILPTATPFSRNAIFSGLFPVEIKDKHPAWWGDKDDESLNAHEAELLGEQLKELVGDSVPVRAAAARARLPVAEGGHRAGLQLHRPADARARRERDPVRGGARLPGAARRHGDVVRGLRAIPLAARGGAARRAGAADDRPRLDPLPHSGDRVCQTGRDRKPALQVR